jgi:hypothetical protein
MYPVCIKCLIKLILIKYPHAYVSVYTELGKPVHAYTANLIFEHCDTLRATTVGVRHSQGDLVSARLDSRPGSAIETFHVHLDTEPVPIRLGNVHQSRADIQRAETLLRFKTQRDLQEGLR